MVDRLDDTILERHNLFDSSFRFRFWWNMKAPAVFSRRPGLPTIKVISPLKLALRPFCRLTPPNWAQGRESALGSAVSMHSGPACCYSVDARMIAWWQWAPKEPSSWSKNS
jgi:hypothetical protein